MGELEELRARVLELEAEVDGLAASRARVEELALQHRVDRLVCDAREESLFCVGVLEVVRACAALQLNQGAALFVAGDEWVEVGRDTRMPDKLGVLLQARETLGFDAPAPLGDGLLAVPLVGHSGLVGALVLGVHATPEWSARWADVLRSVGRAVGTAIERVRIERQWGSMARELEVARDEALAASRAKSRFLANMSHELRTPLNAIIGYGEMLRDDAEDDGLPSYVEDLGKVLSAGRHLLALVTDVLDMTRIEAGHVELEPIRFDVRGLVAGLARDVAPRFAATGSTLEVRVEAEIGGMFADPTKVAQCLTNLLDNAAKFAPRGRAVLTVSRRDPYLLFSVADTGLGMSPDELASVLDAFTQGDGSATRRFGGSGLGLSITRGLCELMGGAMSIASEPGAGTTVELLLPVDWAS
ncbi:MAG: hypothetical protein H6737_21015 [Alphaproteobacteria bacterium]|nr:hypothetical protein [Alphaproteobacteria bacterium]